MTHLMGEESSHVLLSVRLPDPVFVEVDDVRRLARTLLAVTPASVGGSRGLLEVDEELTHAHQPFDSGSLRDHIGLVVVSRVSLSRRPTTTTTAVAIESE